MSCKTIRWSRQFNRIGASDVMQTSEYLSASPGRLFFQFIAGSSTQGGLFELGNQLAGGLESGIVDECVVHLDHPVLRVLLLPSKRMSDAGV